MGAKSAQSGGLETPVSMASAARQPNATASSNARNAETVLVADDDAAMRRLIGAFLKSSAYQVVFAEDGREAVDVARREQQSVGSISDDVLRLGVEF